MTFGDFKWGDRGLDVEAIQRQLSTLGYPVAVDGVFGNETYYAVRQFQSDQGIGVDGVVGPVTQAAMAKALTSSPSTTAAPPGYTIDQGYTIPPVTTVTPTLAPKATSPMSPLVIAAVAGFGAWFFLIRDVKRRRTSLLA